MIDSARTAMPPRRADMISARKVISLITPDNAYYQVPADIADKTINDNTTLPPLTEAGILFDPRILSFGQEACEMIPIPECGGADRLLFRGCRLTTVFTSKHL